MIDQHKIINLLASLHVPYFNQTLAELGLEVGMTMHDRTVQIELDAGFPIESIKGELETTIIAALNQSFPGVSCQVSLQSHIQPHQTQLAGKGLRGVKNTIAIASGKGGVGKSTVAVNLAIALSQAGATVGILDADIYGPSIPMMLGECQPVQVSGEQYLPAKAHGLSAMSIGYLTGDDQALIWRGPMLAKSLLQMIDITRWDNLDYLIIDLPPGTGDIQLSLVQKIPLSGAIVVTTPQNIATLDAEKAIKMFEKTNIHVLGIIENMAMHHCSACGHEEAIFGQGGAKALTQTYQVPLLGRLPLDSQIRRQADEGHPSAVQPQDVIGGQFLKIALKAAAALAGRPLNYADKFPPIVVE